MLLRYVSIRMLRFSTPLLAPTRVLRWHLATLQVRVLSMLLVCSTRQDWKSSRSEYYIDVWNSESLQYPLRSCQARI